MNVLLITPHFHQPRGNTITVQRIANALEKVGVTTEILSSTEDTSMSSLPEADIVHGFHAYKFYTFMQRLKKKPTSYLITITGTDLNHYLYDEKTRQDVITCLVGAEAVHVFNQEGKQTLEQEVPEIKEKLFMIPQGTSDFTATDFKLEKKEDTFLFVLPAGIRKVKNIPAAIEMLKPLHQNGKKIQLWLIGPILEEDEGNLVKNLAADNAEWVSYLGQVPHEQMGAIYQQADCVLNTSISEGQSSAILEAMDHSLPVLVANNQGNASIVKHEETGFLYNSADQFLDYADNLTNNDKLRQVIGSQARTYCKTHHSSDDEAESLLKIYKARMKMPKRSESRV